MRISATARSSGVSVLALLALALAPFLNTLRNGFTIDDEFVYSANSFASHAANLRYFFDARYFQYSGEASYRPVCTLTYFLDRALWGEWAPGPHLTNLLLYSLCVLSVYALALRILAGRRAAAFLAAALFALHPIHTEVVNNIAFREDLLVGLLLPLAWLGYRRARERRPAPWLLLGTGCFLFALFAKESAIVFPLLVLILDWMAGDLPPVRDGRRLRFLGLLIAAAAFFVAVRFFWLASPSGAEAPRLGSSLWATLAADVRIMAYYLRLFLVPHPLHVLYPAPYHAPEINAGWLASAAFLAVVAAAIVHFRRSRVFIGGLLWWFVSLAPVANVYPLFNPMAERYLFLPSIGLCLWAGSGGARLLATRRAWAARAAFAALALALGLACWNRNLIWRSNRTVWSSAARQTPDDPTVLASLAAACFNSRDYSNAVTVARAALTVAEQTGARFNPGPTYVALGSSLLVQGQQLEALAYLQMAEARLPIRPDMDAAVLHNLGMIHDERGSLDKALSYYERAARLTPFQAHLWRKIAFCQLRLGELQPARDSWEKARKLDPGVPTFENMQRYYEELRRKQP